MKELKITPPEGYEIDKEKSTLEHIVFKEIKKDNRFVDSWEDLQKIQGYYTSTIPFIVHINGETYTKQNKNMFATKEQAEASIALAQLSQLLKRVNGDWKPDWSSGTRGFKSYIIWSLNNECRIKNNCIRVTSKPG